MQTHRPPNRPQRSRKEITVFEMSARIVAATDANEIHALRPHLANYFQVINDALAQFGEAVDFDPMMADMMANTAPFLAPMGQTFYALDGEATLGMVFLKPIGAHFELKRLYVDPKAQGTGLGRRLLHHAIAEARALGGDAVYLDTLRALTAAVRLYEDESFEYVPAYPESEVAKNPSIIDHAVFMRLSLV